MLCVKCGEEYEGTSCPRCEGPQILVNNDDYLRRRKAYEEKQAKGSASLSNETGDDAEVDFMVQLAGKVSKKISDKKKQADKEKKQKRHKTRINVKAVAIALVTVVLIIAAVILLVTSLSGKKNLYARYDGNIYTLKKDKLVQLCSDNNTFFTADEKHFYESDVLKDYKSECVIDKQASEKGKLFASVIYDESASKYKVLLSNKNATSTIMESDMRMDIVYVSDKGELVYTALGVVNEEGYAGAYELYIYEAQSAKKPLEGGQIKQLTENLKHTYVLSSVTKVLFIDDESNLCVYDYGKDSNVEYVAENVTGIYVMDNDYADKYSYHTGYVSVLDKSVGVIYSENGKCYYMDFVAKSQERVYMGEIPAGVTTIVYKNEEYMYFLAGDKLSITTYNKVLNEFGNGYDTVLETKKIATINDMSSVLWVPDKKAVVCVNADNDLCTVIKGNVTVIGSDVAADSIRYVSGTKQGIVYSQSNEWYYIGKLEAKPVKITLPQETSVKEVVNYNGRLYMLLSDDKLYMCKANGGELKEIDSVHYIWLSK